MLDKIDGPVWEEKINNHRDVIYCGTLNTHGLVVDVWLLIFPLPRYDIYARWGKHMAYSERFDDITDMEEHSRHIQRDYYLDVFELVQPKLQEILDDPRPEEFIEI